MRSLAAQNGWPQERLLVGPLIVGVRGPSRSGKTALCERLIPALARAGVSAAWVKRTHHAIDLPGKASDRIWQAHPQAAVLRAADRLTVTLDPGSDEPADLAASVPGDVDVVLFETHDPIGHPTILSTALAPARDEQVIGCWDLYGEDAAVAATIPLIAAAIPADRGFDYALRAAMRLHGGHACAGLVLGARLALAGTRALEVPVPDQQKRLLVTCETDRCAVDAIQAVTGCRAGKRTLRLLDFGKLAATFHDERTGRSLRVAARGDLRERVGGAGPERHELQRRAYATWPETELFSFSEARVSVPQFDRPGPPRFRVNCAACGEEVSDHRHVETEAGPMCKSCTAGEIEPARRAM